MRIGKIIISAVAAIAAFGVSLGIVETCNYLSSFLQAFNPNIAKIETAPTIFNEQMLIEAEQPKIAESDEYVHKEFSEFGEDGYYYIIGTPKIGENPKGFKDFEYFSLDTVRIEEKTYKIIPVKPTGIVHTKDVFNFVQLNVNDENITFTTEKRKGISYKLEGKFVEEVITVKDSDNDDYKDTVVIKGRLTKWKNGVKIAEADVNFGFTIGC